MAHHHPTQTKLAQIAGHALAALFAPARDHLPSRFLEWRNRRSMMRSLGNLSDAELRDICLTRADLEAACSDRLDNPAAPTLATVAQSRAGNW